MFLWILLLAFSVSCARRRAPETVPAEPTEASQETPPGVPAVVQQGETAEPSPPNQDMPPGVAPADNEPGEAVPETRPAREETPEVRELLLLGPTYTPHDRPPTVVWDTEAEALVSRKLLPVLQSEGLPARTRALFWLLLRPDGSIAGVVPQTLTDNARFDAAAAEVVRQLRFTPALRNERAVPVWVVQEISLLMQ